MYASRIGIRVSLRRRRKIQRSARNPRLASVRTQAAASHIQKPRRQSTLVDRASFDRISAVPTRPVVRTAAAAASRRTHAIERGDRLLMLADSFHGWCLENFANDVSRFVLRFVIRARLKLRQRTERHELKTGLNEQDAEKQQRAIANRLTLDQLYVRHPSRQAA